LCLRGFYTISSSKTFPKNVGPRPDREGDKK
jgi:hypothetical protein